MYFETELNKIEDELAKITNYNTKEAQELLEKWENLTYKEELQKEKCAVMGID